MTVVFVKYIQMIIQDFNKYMRAIVKQLTVVDWRVVLGKRVSKEFVSDFENRARNLQLKVHAVNYSLSVARSYHFSNGGPLLYICVLVRSYFY